MPEPSLRNVARASAANISAGKVAVPIPQRNGWSRLFEKTMLEQRDETMIRMIRLKVIGL